MSAYITKDTPQVIRGDGYVVILPHLRQDQDPAEATCELVVAPAPETGQALIYGPSDYAYNPTTARELARALLLAADEAERMG